MPQHVYPNVTHRWFLAALATFGSFCVQAADIQVRVAGSAGGTIHAALQSADAEQWAAPLRQLSSTQGELSFLDVPPGNYAVQVFVDLNGNEQLELSPRGIPQEPVGFSTNPGLRRGKPAPSRCSFTHGEEGSLVVIELRQPKRQKNADGSE